MKFKKLTELSFRNVLIFFPSTKIPITAIKVL